MTESFSDVLVAAKRGDRQALATLWRAVNPRLLRYLKGRDPDSAEDIASETWLAVAEALHGFEGNEADFRGWVFTIARHRLIDRYRFGLRHPVQSSDEAGLEERRAPDDPAEDALDALGTDAALRLIRRLPPDQAEVILLRVVGGLDTARVAGILGKKRGTVRVLQHRGLRALARMLGTIATGVAVR